MNKKNIILDTDIGGDCDDVLALAYLLQAHNKEMCNLIGITYGSFSARSPECIRAICRQYGHDDDIPVGILKDYPEEYKDNDGVYAGAVAEAFPVPELVYETAVNLMRKLLAKIKKTEKVTIVAIGPLPNISALLNSQADEISPLDGISLVKEKVKEFAVMGCDFSHENGINPTNKDNTPVAEWNIRCDVEASKTLVLKSPVPIVFLPFEAGNNMITGAAMVKRDGRTKPASLSYIIHGSSNGRHSWDPATALYAVNGAEPWFTLTPPGDVYIDDKGVSSFIERDGGLHFYLKCKLPQAEIAKEIDDMV